MFGAHSLHRHRASQTYLDRFQNRLAILSGILLKLRHPKIKILALLRREKRALRRAEVSLRRRRPRSCARMPQREEFAGVIEAGTTPPSADTHE